ncbi:MAG: SGNH/GDSL hydrolase family protein [Candidatus Cloacimonetes bacterium]|nr:SGNH/GDSL hydrolase family protein [Candidatus Cloacimonadota bacterium]MCF7814928.1 SGNH/GDSL hydrolase family protein [Candidatus Cloacimonadota bacterium]MCF7868146.1 SGNH/GDSL hydrolase family protein [Candidatus Cloacimonadota bacterium]MCF7883612.1 SGNH/GDSL hydrolase family protein [Candidatus Cloacimonadota bacterium]
MKKIILKLLIISLMVIFTSCQQLPTNDNEIAELPIEMNLQPAIDNGFDVTQVIVTITRDDFTRSLELTIENNIASGTFYALQPGIYEIYVAVYESDLLIAEGTGTGEVVAGETITVNIELVLVPLNGNLTIIVDWTNLLPDYPQRLLFIGNSITYYNGGVDEHTMNLANNIDPELGIECNSVTGGGWTLEMHYNNPATIDEITNGNYDMVILQEMTSRPVNDPDLFYYYATALDSIIADSGAQTAFFFSWPFEAEFNTMIEQQAAAYNYIGQQLDAPVFPIARAWQYSLQQNPEIDLFLPDGNHPTVQGTYLACCAFFAFIWHETPVGATYVNDPDITDIERDALQQNAWDKFLVYGN